MPKMVSVNSAIEIDITGQVVSDSIGPKIFSGFGGQVDFIYGASRSKGGKAIIAMPSTTKKGDSKIVGFLKQGAGVVTTRAHVRYIVTEYGIADLYGKSLRERARAMIDIAHPRPQRGAGEDCSRETRLASVRRWLLAPNRNCLTITHSLCLFEKTGPAVILADLRRAVSLLSGAIES